MSETPQEILTTYLHRGYIKGTLGPGEVREAIRAVLDLVRVQYEANEEMTRLLAEAERDAKETECWAGAEEVKQLRKFGVERGAKMDAYPGPRYCKGCGCAWPCPTRRALEGEP